MAGRVQIPPVEHNDNLQCHASQQISPSPPPAPPPTPTPSPTPALPSWSINTKETPRATVPAIDNAAAAAFAPKGVDQQQLQQPKTMNVTLNFPKRYIAHPYWMEQYQKIEIDKKSGINRARTEANRRKALEAHLVEIGMTFDQYKELCAKAERPFHVNEKGYIIIPSGNILSMIVNASDVAPHKMKLQNIRAAIRASDFVTTKTQPDGVWERFAVVNMGTGQKASNQRGHRANPYIENFSATGIIEVEEDMVDPKALVNMLNFAGRVVGIGASRSQGIGRFTVQVK